MTVHYDDVGGAGLRFFGQVSASIAHEIKNVLAIINENAGLLEDLSFAAQRGSAIDPARLDKACSQFAKQIQRADGIMKNMSRFAHSVDVFESQIDLYELTSLVASLAGRPAAMRKLVIEVKAPKAPVVFTGNPFLLQNQIWLCLEFAFKESGAGTTIRLTPVKDDSGVALRIGGFTGLGEDFAEHLPAGHGNLLAALGATLSLDSNSRELILRPA
jgi:C4-dicarboxylate-specific signal transduction histidine kinase